MEESREEKLRRWLEEKKAAKRAEAAAKSAVVGGGGASSVKRSRPSEQQQQQQPLKTPTTATASRRVEKHTTSKGAAEGGGALFSRFGAVADEQQTPVQQNSSRGQQKVVSSALKTPVQRSSHQQPMELKTPSNQRPDTSTSQESLDRRRRLLERTTLVPSARKQPAATAVPASAEKRRGGGGEDAPSSVSRRQERESVGSTLSARRKEAVSRATEVHNAIDMGDVSAVREKMAMIEATMTQWAYMTMRAEKAVEKQLQDGAEQLLRAWALVSEARSAQLQQAMESLKQAQMQRLEDQLAAQYEHLLPLVPVISEFVANYEQLVQSIYSTTHVLPVLGHVGQVDENVLCKELALMDGAFNVVETKEAQELIHIADELSLMASYVKEEFELLKRCRELLIEVELRMGQRRSAWVEDIQNRQIKARK